MLGWVLLFSSTLVSGASYRLLFPFALSCDVAFAPPRGLCGGEGRPTRGRELVNGKQHRPQGLYPFAWWCVPPCFFGVVLLVLPPYCFIHIDMLYIHLEGNHHHPKGREKEKQHHPKGKRAKTAPSQSSRREICTFQRRRGRKENGSNTPKEERHPYSHSLWLEGIWFQKPKLFIIPGLANKP